MKKTTFLLLFAFLLTSFTSLEAQDFITKWKTDNPGNSDDLTITIPIGGGAFNYNVNWGDGTTSSGVTTSTAHTYAVEGTYTVAISGTFPHLKFPSSGDNNKLVSVEQWGSQQWSSMYESFKDCENVVINATDAPDLSNVSDMSNMFKNATAFNQDISTWNVSNVNFMSGMFYNSGFNQDISTWIVSNVTLMNSMFRNSGFNQDISAWNVGNVLDMNNMFRNSDFNQNLSAWDVRKVTNMSNMFYDTPFNQDISAWNVSKVTNMSLMFYSTPFNQNLNAWNVNKVINMYGMFYSAEAFNKDLSGWDVSNVTNMAFMFYGAQAFNGDISTWNVSNVNNMSGMFVIAYAFNQDISAWNVSNVANMTGMFSNAQAFNQDLSTWIVSNITNMSSMFYNAHAFNQDLGTWDVSKVTNMSSMFASSSFNQDLSAWDISKVTNMSNLFTGLTLSLTNYDNTLIGWNTLDVGETQIPMGITINFGTSVYCTGEAAKTNLTSNYGWTIEDGGLDCSTLSISDSEVLEVVLYPNPVKDRFSIKGLHDAYQLQIVNLHGQIVKDLVINTTEHLSISELASGVYFVKIKANDSFKTIKIVKE